MKRLYYKKRFSNCNKCIIDYKWDNTIKTKLNLNCE